MDLDIIVKNKKNKILVIGPSSSGKSTLINEWIDKGLAKKKNICFAYQYNRIKKYTKRIFHYNLLKCYENSNSSNINTIKDDLFDYTQSSLIGKPSIGFYVFHRDIAY